jgi:acyl-[acyl-carrier-protein]-phospholipid O-acyltransferase/long-chain-fatty-acid--[acyl-carrier-protein] ligase
MIKRFFRWLLEVLFDFRAYNVDVLKTPGPVLLVPNHTSWIDWLFLVVTLDDDWRFVVSSTSAETSWVHRKIMINDRSFPVDTSSPYAAKRMAEYLQKNGRLVLFAEGRLSRTGCLMKLFDGTGFLLHKTNAKVITCFLRGAHRLPFSPNKDRKRLFPVVAAHFSDVLTPPHLVHLSTTQSRTILTNWLRDRMILQNFETEMKFGPATVPEAVLATARTKPKHVVLEDITAALSYRKLLIGACLLGEQVRTPHRTGATSRRRAAAECERHARVTARLVDARENSGAAELLDRRRGDGGVLSAGGFEAGDHVARVRGEGEAEARAARSEAGVELLYLEDLRTKISGRDKLRALIRVRFDSDTILKTLIAPEDTAAILFTSGSEGVPKGVELTHANILANIRQMLAVCDLQDWDRFFNALPIFHSFGLTIGTLLPMVRGCYVMLYPSPLHYRVVPTAFYHKDATIMLGTGTFLNGYARKAHALDWRSLRYMFAGAEKLQDATASTWAQKFGVRVLEGYGATECSPCISGNTPLRPKHGTAGMFLPGIEYRLEPVEGVAEGGRLFVRGPNVMRGYLNPEANATFQKLGGWYDTGDIAKVDDDGFVHILGRLKRFAKISGEMVSLTAVEEALAGAFPQYGLRFQVAVVSKPDVDKGEILIAVANDSRLQMDEIRAVIRAKGLPNLCVPRELKFIREIPKLGTGKVNHRELQALV